MDNSKTTRFTDNDWVNSVWRNNGAPYGYRVYEKFGKISALR